MRRWPDWNYLIRTAMVKVWVVSENDDFKADLLMQMAEYVDGFSYEEKMPDVIIVDENIANAEKLRGLYSSTPIILLTSEKKESVDNLHLVVRKPFSLWQLTDMVAAANNKLDNSEEGALFFNGYELRPNARLIIDSESNKTVKLTEKEVDILQYLYKTRAESVSKNDLQTNVWQYHEAVTTHTVETHIYRLRQKVETNGGRRLILTDNGKYRLNMG